MAATSSLLDARPQVRPDVVLGPVLRRGPVLVHNMKDERTGRYFQVGPREHFVIARLDGTRTLAQIGEDYALHFNRRLDEQRWQQILATLAGRHLLVGTDQAHVMAELAEAARRESVGDRTLLKARLPLVDPDRFLTWLAPRSRFLFSRYFVVPVLILAALTEIMVVANAGELFRQAQQLRSAPVPFGLMIAVSWLSIAVHEVGHGLTCKHFGGSVREIGVMWRFPLLAPYCDTTDVLLFENRSHRVYTVFAGVFTTLVLVVPLGVLRLLMPADSVAGQFVAALLLFSSIGIAFNLLPVFQLDGYFMLNHALGMQNLRKESYRFLLSRTRKQAVDHPTAAARVYALYGCVSLAVGTAAAGAAGWWLIVALRPMLGIGLSWLVVLATAVLIAVAALVAGRRQRG